MTAIILPGWTCPCGRFNGAEKEWRERCSACDRIGPSSPTSPTDGELAAAGTNRQEWDAHRAQLIREDGARMEAFCIRASQTSARC